ncbi:phospho-sugar mutase [Conchiformibius steedae DSM 2580]|uniref:Phospho-sugar mutase n=1 Tax=Conchiformibius steedae DSM 2580 TaxID=1121352 RepID=A0AAE9HWE4_9NEIS|nr:phospho-sugar mutase [Conchiformibius steedae]QMT33119.1 phospho-sugar mutase [Conchiformibius steedae]URD67751.1 phospho-sugar mutase [Conchiformibius steedae DSM 2580]
MNNHLLDLLDRACLWAEQDDDTETHAELADLIGRAEAGEAEAQQTLAARFNGRLQFGTAGLRGRLQAGPQGMNRVLVAQAAAGFAAYLHQFDTDPSVVIGYDGRKNSARFAQDTAEIMAGAGINTLLLPCPLPTPVLAYALKRLNLSGGVMVTASHNPPEDNGYKVYLGRSNGGGQIVSPADRDIAAHIDHIAQGNIRDLPRSDTYAILNDEIVKEYVRETAKIVTAAPAPLNYVYTAMHGVGKDVLFQALNAAQLPLPTLVAEQCEPDGSFPTVRFPNPEEAGALDLAIELAKRTDAELILANDPDADRLAVALPDAEGNWHTLHGNTVGCWLAWHMAQRAQAQGLGGTLACSLVSTPALARIAAECGLDYAETLTGFKYIAKVGNLLFGFEEALGYLVDPDKVRDKDGISAALAFLDLVNTLKQQGKTLADYAAEFTARFGAFASSQISIRSSDTAALMNALRQHPLQHIGSQTVVRSQDLLASDHPNDILIYTLDTGNRLIVRPSGTEPKVKFYLDAQGTDDADARRSLAELEHAVRELLRSETYGNQNC